jgi:hypothetical protein
VWLWKISCERGTSLKLRVESFKISEVMDFGLFHGDTGRQAAINPRILKIENILLISTDVRIVILFILLVIFKSLLKINQAGDSQVFR